MSNYHEFKRIIKLALPVMAALLAQKGMQFIDTMMMGWIGKIALAAGALGTSLLFGVLSFSRGTLSSVGIYISFARGENNPHDVKLFLHTGIYLALFLSLPAMIFIWFAHHLLLLLGQDPIVVENTRLLLHGLAWGIPGFLLFMVLREKLVAFRHANATMWVALFSVPLTFIANYILIYGKLGFPALGVAGIGYGGSFVMWLMFFALFIYSKRHPEYNELLSLTSTRIDFKKMLEMFQTGMPSGILGILDVFMFFIAAAMIGFISTDGLAAFQVAMQCAGIAYNIPLAFSIIATVEIGHAIGSKNSSQVERSAYLNTLIGILCGALLSIPFIVTPEWLAKPFLDLNESAAITQYALSFLMIAGFFQCFDAVQCIVIGILRGFKDTTIPMILGFGCYFILGIGSAYLFTFIFHWGPKGIWYGLTIGIFTGAALLLHRLYVKLKHYKLSK